MDSWVPGQVRGLDQWCIHPSINLEAIIRCSLCTKHGPKQEDFSPVDHLEIVDFDHQSTSQITIWIPPLPVPSLSIPLLNLLKFPFPCHSCKDFVSIHSKKEKSGLGRSFDYWWKNLTAHPTNNSNHMLKCWPMDAIFIYRKLFITVGFTTLE